MKNQTLIIILAVVLIIGGVLGFFIKGCTIPKPIPQTSHVDTLRIKADTVKIVEKHWYALPKDTITNEVIKYSNFTLQDSIQGIKNEIGYKVSTTVIIDSTGIVWDWKTQFIPPDKITIYDTTYVPQIVEVDKPYYKDTWFYVALVEGIAGIYVVIKVIQALIK